MQTEAIVLITLYVLGCVAVVYTHRRYTRIARSIDAMLIVHSVTRPVGIHPLTMGVGGLNVVLVNIFIPHETWVTVLSVFLCLVLYSMAYLTYTTGSSLRKLYPYES